MRGRGSGEGRILAASADRFSSLCFDGTRAPMPTAATSGSNGAPLIRHRESHQEAIYQVAFNDVDTSLTSTFATVGANRVTVYGLVEASAADEAAETVVETAGTKRGSDVVAPPTLKTLQAYCDEDEQECFYCCAWGVEEAATSGELGSLLAVAGAQRHIKVLDCCTATVRCVLAGHGGAVNELRFHPTSHSLLLSASADESLRLWHVPTSLCLATYAGDAGHRDAVVSLDIRFDGAAFASGSIDGTVKVWPIHTEALLEQVATADAAAAEWSRGAEQRWRMRPGRLD